MSMKPVGWLGQEADRHEHCYPTHKTVESSADVLAEGFKVVRVGDAVAPHSGTCNKHPAPHGAKVQKGSASVFANGKPLARQGDAVKCDTGQTAPLLQGRAKVLVGDASPVGGAKESKKKDTSELFAEDPGIQPVNFWEDRQQQLKGEAERRLPPKNRLDKVRATLQSKHLEGSFKAHLIDQLVKNGRITVGVVDDFSSGTHGKNVVERILLNVPESLRPYVDVRRYDIGGNLSAEQKAAVLQRAAADADKKGIVALSLSGGMEPYGVDSIATWIGRPLDKSSAGLAFSTIADKAKLTPAERQAWESLQQATSRIPVVTPVWNNNSTTLAALALASENGIVTSIDTGNSSQATEVPLFDIRMPRAFNNPTTSQSPPTFIGQAMGVLSPEEVKSALARGKH